jgi:UDP-glucuronate 4-epimerase
VTPTFVVTGAAGFIGSHLTRTLVAQGVRVVATDVATALPAPVLAGLDAAGCTYVAGDLRDDATLDALVEAASPRATVVHVAALLRFAEMAAALGQAAPSFPSALEVFDVNATASWRLCERFAAPGHLDRFVYVSTRSVFGGATPVGEDIDETCPPSPVGIYGSSKTAAEVGLLAFRDVFGLDLVVARVTGVFGPWQGPVSWIGNAVQGVLDGSGYRATSGADDRYEFTYVKDTVRGLSELAMAACLAHPIYHVSSGAMHSLGEVAEAFHLAAPDVVVEFGPGAQPGMRARRPLRGARMDEELGFRARWGLPAAIEDYVAVERTGVYGPEAAEVLSHQGPRG